MDPITQGILAGVIANGLTGLISLLGREATSLQERETTLNTLLQEDVPLGTILQRAVSSVAKQLGGMEETTSQQVKFFLLSPDAEAIARQIFSTKLGKAEQTNLSVLSAEFSASLSLHLKKPESSVAGLAQALFAALIEGCDRALSLAIEKGLLSAHEAMSAARQRVVLDEIDSIKKNLDLLAGRERIDVAEINAFEEKYRNLVAEKHGYIIPPNFDAARRVPIDKIYVAPSFLRPPEKKAQEPTTLDLGELLSALYRVVILGNPGGGKSTLSQKLCHDLALRHRERVLSGRRITPILVVLRDYGASKKEKACSIVQFMEATSNSTYQLEPPKKAFEYLLLNGRALVIFDGLDELLETSFRREVTSDVELFCSLYPSVPVLVTSREVGYEQAPLDHKRFVTLRLAPFNDERVREYVTKWFSDDWDLPPEQRKQKIDSFLEESGIVADLRGNPLLLALMCNIYRGDNYIPRNRPDVYEKCSTMLFEKWDKSRGLFTPLEFESQISPAMKHLAHWIYTEEKLQAGVTERALIAEATRYLCPKRYEDEDEARAAAFKFINFCRGRAWVFTDTGTTADGEPLYQFTHRTFLEYFTAAHIVRTHPTPELLGNLLTCPPKTSPTMS